MLLGGISPFMRGMIEPGPEGQAEAPDNIIQNLDTAYQQYVYLRQDHVERIALYAAIDGMISGNPPFDENELEANGLGHIANFNNFKARANYERSAQGFWNLINSTEVFTKIVIDPNFPDAQKWASIMARHFSDIVKEWEDFAPNFNLLGAQITKYGLCPIFFPHEESPIWEVVDVSRFFIASQSQSFVSKLSTVAIDTTYTVQDLYQIYKETGSGDAWNKEALGNFLIYRGNYLLNTATDGPGWNFMDVQRFIDTNAAALINANYFNDTVRITNMYQKEYNEGISHYMFSPEWYAYNRNGQNGLDSKKDFLYFVDRQYKRIEDAVIIFTASPGEWNIHSNVGVGQKIYAMAQAINMLDCSIVDMSRMSATPLIKTLGTGGRDIAPIRFLSGVATDIGAAEFQQNNLGDNISQLVGASQYLTQGMEINAVNSGDDPGIPDRSQGSISPSEARSRAFTEFGVLKNVVAHFYNTFDKVIRKTFISFLTMGEDAPGYELCKAWKERCEEDGVPKELFDSEPKGLHDLPKQFRSVRAARVAGDGSTLARIMGLEALNPIMGTFNDKEIAAYKREWVTATVGVDYIDTFANSAGQSDETAGGASLATVENGLMELGKPAKFSPDNDQPSHGFVHMTKGAEIQQGVSQQQLSSVDADRELALLIPHLQEHIDFMYKSPQFYRQALNSLIPAFKELRQWAELNRKNALSMIQAAKRKQEEDAAATQEVMSDEQRKNYIAQADVARKDQNQTSKDNRADKANEVRGELMRTKIEKDADNKRVKIELEAETKQQATAKGRSQAELAAKNEEELNAEIANITGSTPSTIDFERI